MTIDDIRVYVPFFCRARESLFRNRMKGRQPCKIHQQFKWDASTESGWIDCPLKIGLYNQEIREVPEATLQAEPYCLAQHQHRKR